VQESITSQVLHKSLSHEMGSHRVTSHDGCGKVVHRPCSSCISSVENLIGTLLSSSCQLGLGVDLSCLG